MEIRTGDFYGRERKDIDGYGDLMAYCSTLDRSVMSLVTLSDVGGAACLPCIKSWGGQDDFKVMRHCQKQREPRRFAPSLSQCALRIVSNDGQLNCTVSNDVR